MTLSPRLSLSYVAPSQAQKHVTVNETFRRLDALVQLSVRSRTVSAEPGSPAEGDAYILPAGPTGAGWLNFTQNNIAVFQDGAWAEIAAVEGACAWVSDEDIVLHYNGSLWTGPAKLGVGTGAPGQEAAIVGKVTIGAASAAYPNDLTVIGSAGEVIAGANGQTQAVISNSGNAGISINAGANSDSRIYFSRPTAFGNVAAWLEYDHANNEMNFYVAPGNAAAGVKRMNIFPSGGVNIGAPTGGDKGAGTLNVQAVYDDNTLLTCYVFDQALDGAVDLAKWDGKAPDRNIPANIVETLDEKTGKAKKVMTAPARTIARRHEPLRKFAARVGTAYDPMTLDGYARHWREKRHLTSMPNEAAFDPVNDQLTTGEWIQRLVETVEIQAVLIEQLNQRTKMMAAGK